MAVPVSYVSESDRRQDDNAVERGVGVDAELKVGFECGKRRGLIIRNESANPVCTTGFVHGLFEREGGDAFDERRRLWDVCRG